jgi:hypothetical protein
MSVTRQLCRTLSSVLAAALAIAILAMAPSAHAASTAQSETAPAKPARRDASRPKQKSKEKAPAQSTTSASQVQAPAPSPPEPTPQLAAAEVVAILGRKIVSPSNEELGRLVNVLVDDRGQARAAVIDFGGFLGVGSRKIAVDWGQLAFKPDSAGGQIALSMTREQIQGAREFKENTPEAVDVAAPPPAEKFSDRSDKADERKNTP